MRTLCTFNVYLTYSFASTVPSLIQKGKGLIGVQFFSRAIFRILVFDIKTSVNRSLMGRSVVVAVLQTVIDPARNT